MISDNPLEGSNRDTSTRNPTNKYPKKLINYPVNQFHIHVNEGSYFQSKLPHITNSKSLIKMKGLEDIRKMFNLEDPYFVSLAAMYTASFQCGISIHHLHESDGVPKIITSIIRFHVYFWLRRFIKNPKLLKPYSSMMGDLKEYIATRHIELEAGPDGGGNTGLFDTITYIAIKSNGLTNIGLKCLNQSIEAYVYRVLGSQAWTRTSIMGHVGGSLETQDQFRQLVEDSVINYSISMWILNMNKAIGDTNVTQKLSY